MNALFVSVFLLLIVSIVSNVIIYSMSIKLKKSKHLNIILLELLEENLLRKEFTINASVKKFFQLIDIVGAESLNADRNILLNKYFNKVFQNHKASSFTELIKEIELTKYSKFIMSAFIEANAESELGLLGEAIFIAIKDCDDEKKEILDNFLKKLPLDSQKNQLMFVVECLNKYLDIELGDHVVSEIRTAMEAARAKIEKRIEFIK